MTGYQLDESKNPNFVAVQAAGAAGLLRASSAWRTSGLTPQEDHNNIQPRVGGVLDVRGNGKDIVRGGWGVYTDVGYTNSNVLFAAADSTGKGFGQIVQRQRDQRHQEPRRQLLPVPASRSRTSRARTRSSAPARSR